MKLDNKCVQLIFEYEVLENIKDLQRFLGIVIIIYYFKFLILVIWISSTTVIIVIHRGTYTFIVF